MFYAKNGNQLLSGIERIYYSITSDRREKLSNIITDLPFALQGTPRNKLDFFEYPLKDPSGGPIKGITIFHHLLREFSTVFHFNPFRFFTTLRDTVFLSLTFFVARCMASFSSLLDRIWSVSRRLPNFSRLKITALPIPFLVMVNLSCLPSTSLMMEERFFFVSASGSGLFTMLLLSPLYFDYNNYRLSVHGQHFIIKIFESIKEQLRNLFEKLDILSLKTVLIGGFSW